MKKINSLFFDDKTNKINKKDWIIIGIMVFIYGLLSFYRLGDFNVPSTYKTFENEDDSEIITLNDESYIYKMRYYTGNNIGEFDVSYSFDGNEYEPVTTFKVDSVFTWQDLVINREAKYIKISSLVSGSTLGDVQFYDRNSNKISSVIEKDNPLLDELNLVPEEISFLNSTYFDEIYYARSGYEYVHGIDSFEWTHPPLGKIIISIPILLFGFSPFTFRLMANLAGVFMIPVMYVLAKKLFKNRKWAILAAALMMFDTFHFAHTRIALIDGFQVLFILLSVLFMKMYMDIGKEGTLKKKSKYLILSGVFIGCAIATKWNALYIGLGLFIVFINHLLKEYGINLFKECKKKFSLDIVLKYLCIFVIIPYAIYFISYMFVLRSISSSILVYYFAILILLFLSIGLIRLVKLLAKDSYLLKLFIISFVSFIIIPLIIYILSYIVFPTIRYYDKSLLGIIDMTKKMYDYHANLVATHPFSSEWYQWPIMYRPVWFYVGTTTDGLRMTISDIGNIAIWWGGVISFVFLVIHSIRKKDNATRFLLIFILCSYIPYIFVSRLMFMYHFFITLPFIMLGIVAFIKWITEKTKSDKIYFYYLALVIITFIIFYPVVSGMPIREDYVRALKWLPEWYL